MGARVEEEAGVEGIPPIPPINLWKDKGEKRIVEIAV